MKKDRIVKKCQNCNKEFETRPYLVEKRNKGKYCSLQCYWKAKVGKKLSSRGGRVNRVCLNCKIQFETWRKNVKKGNGKFCNKKCLGIANGKRSSGSGNWNWKGGISPRPLSTVRYKNWRKAVFERDGYKCVLCGYSDGRIIQADHIKSWAKYPKLRYKVENGRTLCKPCHIKTPTWGSKVHKK